MSRELERLLGRGDLAPAEPVPMDAAQIPKPAFPIPDALAGFASQERLDRAAHTYGRTFRDVALGFAGDFSAAPDLVCTPETEAEILAAMEWCSAHRVALIRTAAGRAWCGAWKEMSAPTTTA